MIDFTNLPKRKKTYAGANGSKISVIYEGEQYMLKFGSTPILMDNCIQKVLLYTTRRVSSESRFYQGYKFNSKTVKQDKLAKS